MFEVVEDWKENERRASLMDFDDARFPLLIENGIESGIKYDDDPHSSGLNDAHFMDILDTACLCSHLSGLTSNY